MRALVTNPTVLGAELREPTAPPDEVRRDAARITEELMGDRDVGDPGGGIDPGTPGEPGSPIDAPGTSFDLPAPEGLGAIGQAVVWVLLVGLAVLVAWLVIRAVKAWLRSRRRAHQPEAVSKSSDAVIPAEDPPLPADAWIERALAAEDAGDWREGLRCRLRSLVVVLEASGHLQEVAGLTVGELRAELEANSLDLASGFAEACELFERAWYGHLPTGPHERDRFAALAENLQRPTEAA